VWAVFRAIFGYCFLVFIVRIAGRRPGEQLSPFEFVLIFYMGGITLTSMVGDERSITNAFCQVITIGLTHLVIARIKFRWPRFARIVDGTPLVLVEKGHMQLETMRRMRIAKEDIMEMARSQGLECPEQIDYAVLERNGEISIIPGATQN
jgi:uncharacterized membrane protein YcaP (DUF421 family)